MRYNNKTSTISKCIKHNKWNSTGEHSTPDKPNKCSTRCRPQQAGAVKQWLQLVSCHSINKHTTFTPLECQELSDLPRFSIHSTASNKPTGNLKLRQLPQPLPTSSSNSNSNRRRCKHNRHSCNSNKLPWPSNKQWPSNRPCSRRKLRLRHSNSSCSTLKRSNSRCNTSSSLLSSSSQFMDNNNNNITNNDIKSLFG